MTEADMKAATAAGQLIPLVEIQGEPRARDVDIGEKLGFAHPRRIRSLIARHEIALARMGEVRTAAVQTSAKGGRPTSEYWLNEKQALFLTAKSDAKCADEVLSVLVCTFVAWRSGHLSGVSLAPQMLELLTGIIVKAVDDRIATDPRRAVLDFVSVRQLLDEAKALQKGRNRVNRRLGKELRDAAALSGGPDARRCPHTGTWLFRREFTALFMRQRGNDMVREHNDRMMGQGVIKFPAPVPSTSLDA